MLTEEHIADWLKKLKEKEEEEEKVNNEKIKSSRNTYYTIKDEEEWKEILKNHNVPYYPRFKDKGPEETYQLIRAYFDKKEEKPSFCSVPTKVVKLEKRLEALNKKLLLMEGITKKEEDEIRQKIKWIEKKLYIRG